jgi:phosphocarrier protein
MAASQASPDGQDHDPPEQTTELLIVNRRGLHARAAAKFVKTAERFEAEIEVSKDGTTVAGTSIMGLMMLAAAPGSWLQVRARGPDAAAALAAIGELVGSGFGEELAAGSG